MLPLIVQDFDGGLDGVCLAEAIGRASIDSTMAINRRRMRLEYSFPALLDSTAPFLCFHHLLFRLFTSSFLLLPQFENLLRDYRLLSQLLLFNLQDQQFIRRKAVQALLTMPLAAH